MRSTAPAAVAASRSCSRARLVAPPSTGPGGARRCMTIGRVVFRSGPRCRSPQHARRREVPSRSSRPTTSATSDPIAQLGMSRRAGLHLADDRYTDLGAGPNRLTRSRAPELMPMPSARTRPAAISPSWCIAAGGTPERDDDDSDGDLHGSRRHAAPASRSTIEHLGRRRAASGGAPSRGSPASLPPGPWSSPRGWKPSSERPSPRSRPHAAGGTAAVKVGEHAVQARRSASPLVVEPGSGPRARNSRPT